MTAPLRDLQGDLRTQLKFIMNSCQAFDRGEVSEALRISVALRVILHNTQKSKSLLSHLDAEGALLLSTAGRGIEEFEELAAIGGWATDFDMRLGHLVGSPQGMRYVACLDDVLTTELLPAMEWWNQLVWILNGLNISRRDLVLAAANQDGGAHIDKDAKLSVEYETLLNTVGGLVSSDPSPDESRRTVFVAIRQMGHELLRSQSLLVLAGLIK